MKKGEKMGMRQRMMIAQSLMGHEVSVDTRAKIAEKSKGRHPVCEFKPGHLAPKTAFKKGLIPWNKGKHTGSTWMLGRCHTPESIERNRVAHLGRKASIETRRKQSAALIARRERHWAWRGGITKENAIIRRSLEYRLWREAVFRRDNYTCVQCGARNGNGKRVILHADHIKPFAFYSELRFDVSNGRTLCVPFHELTDTYKSKAYKYAKNN